MLAYVPVPVLPRLCISELHGAVQMFIIIIIIFFYPSLKRGWEKLRKVERGLKWKTSPGGPQRENRRAAIRH